LYVQTMKISGKAGLQSRIFFYKSIMSRVLVTGGRGLIGQHLCKRLQDKGYEVALLSRSSSPETTPISNTWNLDRNEIDRKALNSCDFIIHLAGANIGAKRWTSKRKQEILDSRIKSVELIFNNINKQNRKLKAFISASAIGYYGATTSEQIFDESDSFAVDFLGQTCKNWEDAADRFTKIGVRTVKIRTGIVLSKDGGAMAKLKMPIQWGLGSAIGSGEQFMPWIHMEDLCNIYIHALENAHMKGPYNAVAPDHVTNKTFIRKTAQTLHKPFWFPNIPAIAMKLMFGEMAAMLLEGSRVTSDKIRKEGFSFQFPDLDSALKELYFEDSP